MDCSNNQLTDIPASLSEMIAVEQLYLRHNKLCQFPKLPGPVLKVTIATVSSSVNLCSVNDVANVAFVTKFTELSVYCVCLLQSSCPIGLGHYNVSQILIVVYWFVCICNNMQLNYHLLHKRRYSRRKSTTTNKLALQMRFTIFFSVYLQRV